MTATSAPATKQDLNDLFTRMQTMVSQTVNEIIDNKVVSLISEVSHEILQAVADRFDGVDARLDGVDARLDGVDARIDSVDVRLDGIDSRLDNMDSRLDGVDVRLDGIDSRLDGMAYGIKDLQTVVLRVDNKLNDISDAIHDHSAKIRLIQSKIA